MCVIYSEVPIVMMHDMQDGPEACRKHQEQPQRGQVNQTLRGNEELGNTRREVS